MESKVIKVAFDVATMADGSVRVKLGAGAERVVPGPEVIVVPCRDFALAHDEPLRLPEGAVIDEEGAMVGAEGETLYTARDMELAGGVRRLMVRDLSDSIKDGKVIDHKDSDGRRQCACVRVREEAQRRAELSGRGGTVSDELVVAVADKLAADYPAMFVTEAGVGPMGIRAGRVQVERDGVRVRSHWVARRAWLPAAWFVGVGLAGRAKSGQVVPSEADDFF